jgi:primosomal protein N' (replication factor Y)
MMPELPALHDALRHDFEAFAEQELAARRRVGLPPFRRIARVVLAHPREETARREAEALAERIRDGLSALRLEEADVLGPNPCALPRLRGRYRFDLILRTIDASHLQRLTGWLIEAGALRTKAEFTVIDVDPVEMM